LYKQCRPFKDERKANKERQKGINLERVNEKKGEERNNQQIENTRERGRESRKE
jgi:hypothetical protein